MTELICLSLDSKGAKGQLSASFAIDTKSQDKGISTFSFLYDLDLGEHLVSEGIEALINCERALVHYPSYGLPVRKARNSSSTLHYLDF